MTGGNGRFASRKITGLALLLVASSSLLAGCTAWVPLDKNDTQLVGPAPYSNQTPMNAALVCLRPFTHDRDLRLGVADFVDGSGATMGNNDVNGRYFSQRPDLMMIVALNKAGVRLVNRTSTAVAEWEMRQAMDKRLGDGKPTVVGSTKYDYRPIHAGDFLGSNYYIHGAITEINWALSNNVEEYGFLGLNAGKTTYRVSIAIDLAVTNSETTEVVFARSYAKQLVGYQVGAGVFRFVDVSVGPTHTELFESNVGDKKNEPVQRALRWLIESAAYDTIAELEGRHQSCDALVPGLYDSGPPDQVGVGGLLPFLGSRSAQPDPDAPVKTEPQTVGMSVGAPKEDSAKPSAVPVSAAAPSRGPQASVKAADAAVPKSASMPAPAPNAHNAVAQKATSESVRSVAAALATAISVESAAHPGEESEVLRMALRMVSALLASDGSTDAALAKAFAIDRNAAGPAPTASATPSAKVGKPGINVANYSDQAADVWVNPAKRVRLGNNYVNFCDIAGNAQKIVANNKCIPEGSSTASVAHGATL